MYNYGWECKLAFTNISLGTQNGYTSLQMQSLTSLKKTDVSEKLPLCLFFNEILFLKEMIGAINYNFYT